MNSERVVGIVLYGEMKERKKVWKDWHQYAQSVCAEMNYKLTHFAILCDFLDEKIKTFSRSEKKLLEAINSEKEIDAISLYALKKGVRSTINNEICFILSSKYKYAYCEISLEKYNTSLGKKLISGMRNFVECKNSEIFSMERNQVAFNYVMKGRGYNISKYPTLEIINSEP